MVGNSRRAPVLFALGVEKYLYSRNGRATALRMSGNLVSDGPPCAGLAMRARRPAGCRAGREEDGGSSERTPGVVLLGRQFEVVPGGDDSHQHDGHGNGSQTEEDAQSRGELPSPVEKCASQNQPSQQGQHPVDDRVRRCPHRPYGCSRRDGKEREPKDQLLDMSGERDEDPANFDPAGFPGSRDWHRD